MAEDIQIKIIDANPQNESAVIQAPKAAGSDAYGSNYTLDHPVKKDMTDTEAFNKYNNRFVS